MKQLIKKNDDASFDVFQAIVNKYKAPNAEMCVKFAHKKVTNDPVARRFLNSFRNFNLEGDVDEEVASDFPEFEFKMALFNLDHGELSRILIEKGWMEAELDSTICLMKQLHRERSRYDFGTGCQALYNLDDICAHLITAGIENKRASLLAILPPLQFGYAEVYREQILKCAQDESDAEPNNPLLKEIYDAVIRLYSPQAPE